MSEFTIIDRILNMHHTVHIARSLYKLVSTYWEIVVFRTRSKMEHFGKIIIIFNYFCKNSVLGLWDGPEYVWGFKYARALNVREFSLVWQVSEYARRCNYGRFLNIPQFRVCQVSSNAGVAQDSEYTWIWLNNAL